MEILTTNLAGGVTTERIDGREVLVAPIVLLVPGVLNGSNGPLLYRRDNVCQSASAWENIPIILGHPDNGEAFDPVLGNALGYLRNVECGEKLTAEGVFDVRELQRLSSDVYNALARGHKLEVSTGLGTRKEAVAPNATYRGEPYVGIVKELFPDHLAILLSQKGACSISDGCGVLMNVDQSQFAPFGEPSDYLNDDGTLRKVSQQTDGKTRFEGSSAGTPDSEKGGGGPQCLDSKWG